MESTNLSGPATSSRGGLQDDIGDEQDGKQVLVGRAIVFERLADLVPALPEDVEAQFLNL